jgi:hypothetical protein
MRPIGVVDLRLGGNGAARCDFTHPTFAEGVVVLLASFPSKAESYVEIRYIALEATLSPAAIA